MSAPGLPEPMHGLKVWRLTGHALQAAGFQVAAARRTGSGHLAVTVAQDGRRASVVVSSTPRDIDNLVDNTVKEARRRLAGRLR